MAQELHKTESEAKHGMTSAEFVRHQVILERRRNETRTDHWYMALLASLLYCVPYRVWGQDVPQDADKPSTFLLKFGTQEEIAEKEEDMMSEEESAKYAELQKSIWLGIFGMDKDGNKVTPEGDPVPPPPAPVVSDMVTGPPAPAAKPASSAPPRPRVRVYTSHGH